MSEQKQFPKLTILNVEIDSLTDEQVVAYIDNHIEGDLAKPRYIVKPYVEFMTRAYHDLSIADILNNADLCLPDGVSLQWAASVLYGQPKLHRHLFDLVKSLWWIVGSRAWLTQVLPYRHPGPQLTDLLLKKAGEKQWRIGIIGGSDSHEALSSRLTTLYPGLKLVRVINGFYKPEDESAVVRQLTKAKLDILFVALGFPKQELFIRQYMGDLRAKLLIGEGGTFDYDQFGGLIKRAPKTLQKLGLEWLWRLVRQPSRLKRQLAIPQFIYYVYRSLDR